MVKTKAQRASMLALAGVLSVGMLAGTMGVQKVQADTPANAASITVGKTLTINGTKFPNIENFNFKLEPVQGYINPNTDTKKDGQTITAANVPTPGPSGTTGQTVTKSVGDFRTTEAGDTASMKVRKDPFDKITYTTAGYYLYRLTEVVPSPKISGVVYDESNYYVVVYVVNNIDAQGNTIDGVHVESVTAWHNAKGSSENAPNLKDIAANGYQNGDNNTGDNNGQNPKPNNTYGGGQTTTSNPAAAQMWDDLGKVGRSTPSTPSDPNNTNGDNRNVLDATKFWNRQDMHDIALTKNVKGNLGDRTKQFEFTVTMHGLEAGQSYAVQKTGSPTLGAPTTGAVGSVDNAANKITADGQGDATFLVKIADDQGINLKDIPTGATYQISEAASNHAPSYAITSDSAAAAFIYTAVTGADAKADPSKTYYTSNDGTDVAVDNVAGLDDADTVYTKAANNAAPIIASASGNTSGAKETALATSTETVDTFDANITVAYTNDRNLETITGIPSMAIYFAAAGLLALLAFVGIRRRRDDGIAEM